MKGESFESDGFNSINYFLNHLRSRDVWVRNSSVFKWQNKGYDIFMGLVDNLDEIVTVQEV